MVSTLPDVPTRWQGHRLRHPPARFRKLAGLLSLHVRDDDPDVIALRGGLMRGDPVADAFVTWAAEQPSGRGRQVFERVVEHGLEAVPDAPECLVRWFAPLQCEPRWLNPDALRLACRTAHRVGSAGGTILSAMALMGGYRSSAAVKPLAMTGALDRMVVRRIGETSRFVLDVYGSETLPRFSSGFKSACRVRLMHAMVRRSLTRRADWDTRAWGVPINQSDMAGTNLEFSATYLTGLTLLGFRFTRDERQAIMHLWRYVSGIMGVDDALLAKDYRQGLRQMYIHALTNPTADEDSRALARALHELPMRFARSPAERVLARVQMRYHTAVSRFTIGDQTADDIGLPRAPLYPLLVLLSAGRFGVETLRRHVPGATALAARRGRTIQQRATSELLGARPVEFIPYADRSPAHAAAGAT